MEAPRIALRFRDAAAGIDTIVEHRAIIEKEGAVWWGWWKKETEPAHDALLASLDKKSGRVLLVDRSTKRCFDATFLRVASGKDLGVDPQRIPSYYRASKAVYAWFLLTKIQDIGYREDVGRNFGDTTLLDIQGELGHLQVKAVDRVEVGRRSMLHLSDLHFGADYAFLPPGIDPAVGEERKGLTDCLVRDLERIGRRDDVGAVLVTGDFTTRGDWSDRTRGQILREFEMLRRALGLESRHIVAIPGNHDVVRYPSGSGVDADAIAVQNQVSYKHEREFRTFSEELTERSWKYPLNHVRSFGFGEVDVMIGALNSCAIAATNWTEYGYVGAMGCETLEELSRLVSRKPTFRIMALHHHLVPVNSVEAPNGSGVSLTLDAVNLLDAASRVGVQIAIHGHQHLARVARYHHLSSEEAESGGMVIVAGGSTSVHGDRLPGSERNTYSLLSFTEFGAHLVIRELRTDGRVGASLFDRSIAQAPLDVSRGA